MKKNILSWCCAIFVIASSGALSGCARLGLDYGQASTVDSQGQQECFSGVDIPLEEALRSLEEFLDGTDMTRTKSGFRRRIASVELYSPEFLKTKSSSGDTSGLSGRTGRRAAYVVNFEDSLGFAVLGATSDVPAIVAVAEEGTISPAKGCLDVRPEPDSDNDGSRVIRDYIHNALSAPNSSHSSSGSGSSADASSAGRMKPSSYGTCLPLLKTNWNQGRYDESGLWNKYCVCNGHNVYAGCGTVALAQVLAFNRCNDPAFNDYYGLRIFSDPSGESYLMGRYSEVERDRLSEFIGTIFHLLSHNNIGPGGTSTAPAQIKNLLVALDGYTNNTCSNADCFCDAMVDMTRNMLEEGKPVIVSANNTIECGHTWVIDGASYFGDDYLVHCNWGWGGASNGYFHTSCFNPHNGERYDDPYYVAGNDMEFNWLFRMITYDLQK